MAFDPDAFVATPTQAPPSAGFDPDSFVAQPSSTPKASGFDPDQFTKPTIQDALSKQSQGQQLSRQEHDLIYDFNQNKPTMDKVGDFVNNAETGVGDLAGSVYQAGKDAVTSPVQTITHAPSTALEAGARGTLNDVDLAKNVGTYIGDKAYNLVNGATPDDLKSQSYSRYLSQFNDQSKRQADIQSGGVLPQGIRDVLGNPINSQADIGSMVLDPAMLATSGAGRIAGGIAKGLAPELAEGLSKAATATKGAIGDAATTSLKATGSALKDASEYIPNKVYGTIEDKLGPKAAEAVKNLAESPGAKTARRIAAGASAMAGATSPLEIAAAASEIPELVGKAGEVTQAAGQVTQAMTDTAKQGLTRQDALKTVALNKSYPEWLRTAANNIYQSGIGDALNATGKVIKGAAEGAAINTGLSAAQGQDAGQMGQAFGQGAALGGIGSLIDKTGADKATYEAAKQADINRKIAESVKNGTPIQTFKNADPDDIANISTFDQMLGDTKSHLVNKAGYDSQYAQDNPGHTGSAPGAAYYSPSEKKIVVNVEAGNIFDNFAHEVGHALKDNPQFDTPSMRFAVDQSLGPNVEKMGQKYTYALASDELKNEGVKTPSLEQLGQRSIEIQQKLDANDIRQGKQPNDWLYGELFNEFTQATLQGKDIRKDVLGKTSEGEKLNFATKFLQSLGVPFKQDNSGKLAEAPSSIFGKLPLSDQMRQLVYKSIRDRDKFVNEFSSGEPGASFIPKSDLAAHPASGLTLNKKTGLLENEFFREAEPHSGVLVPKDINSILNSEVLRSKEVMSLFGEKPKNPVPYNDPDPTVKWRMTTDGKVVLSGRKMPDAFYSLKSVPDEIKAKTKQFEGAIAAGNGQAFNMWYNKVLATKAGLRKMFNSGLSAEYREAIPYGFQISIPNEKGYGDDVTRTGGNIQFMSFDRGLMDRKALRWGDKGKLDRYYGGNVADFYKDLKQYTQNHQQGVENSKFFGKEKSDFLNSFFGMQGKKSLEFNPLKADLSGKDKNPMIRGFRVDRAQDVKASPREGLPYDYSKQMLNLKPNTGAIQKS